MSQQSLTFVIRYATSNGEIHTARLTLVTTNPDAEQLQRSRSAIIRHIGPALRDAGINVVQMIQIEEQALEIDLPAQQTGTGAWVDTQAWKVDAVAPIKLQARARPKIGTVAPLNQCAANDAQLMVRVSWLGSTTRFHRLMLVVKHAMVCSPCGVLLVDALNWSQRVV